MTLLITTISAVRYALNNPSRPPAGPSWLQAWSSIELSVSICVASAASFRAFVVQRTQVSSGRAQGSSYSGMKKPRGGNRSTFSRLESAGGDSSQGEGEGRREAETVDVELAKRTEVVGREGKGIGDRWEEMERGTEHRMAT